MYFSTHPVFLLQIQARLHSEQRGLAMMHSGAHWIQYFMVCSLQVNWGDMILFPPGYRGVVDPYASFQRSSGR